MTLNVCGAYEECSEHACTSRSCFAATCQSPRAFAVRKRFQTSSQSSDGTHILDSSFLWGASPRTTHLAPLWTSRAQASSRIDSGPSCILRKHGSCNPHPLARPCHSGTKLSHSASKSLSARLKNLHSLHRTAPIYSVSHVRSLPLRACPCGIKNPASRGNWHHVKLPYSSGQGIARSCTALS